MLWLFLGIIIGYGLALLVTKVRAGQLTVKWYQWLLGALGTALLLFTIQNYIALGSLEYNAKAAGYTWSVFGLPALLFYALIWLIPIVVKLISKKTTKASA